MRILHIHEAGSQAMQVSALLRSMSFTVDEAPSIDEGLATLESGGYDVAIVDVDDLPEDRLRDIEAICGQPQPCQVVVCGSFDALPFLAKAVEKGARDFLLRPIRPAELKVRLIKAAVHDRVGVNTRPAMPRFGPLRLDLISGEISLGDAPLELTPRLRGVLSVMVRARGGIVDKEQIASRIFGLEDEASARSIETYVSRLRRKLKGRGVTIETVRGLGYRLSEEVAAASVAQQQLP